MALVSNTTLSSNPTHRHSSLATNFPQQVASPPQQVATLLFVGFNQDYGCFACGTDTGFRVYNCDPFKEILRRDFDDGGIGLVEMLFRCNILALVGGGKRPRYPSNKVMIWDDHQARCIGELPFRSEVRAIKLKRDCIVVVLEYSVHVYNLTDLRYLFHIETMSNTKGLCALSPMPNASMLACPGIRKGEVQIEHLQSKKPKFVMVHDSQLACIALSQDGQLLATASKKGTLIRIYNTGDGNLSQELRRGADRAEIYSLAFSASSQWLAVSSDKGTIHVFGLRVPIGVKEPKCLDSALGQSSNDGSGRAISSGKLRLLPFTSTNPGSSFSFLKGVLPKYFSSEWSFAQFRLPEEIKSIVAFGPQKNTVIILGSDGSLYRCAFDPVNGGEMIQEEYSKFFKPEDEIFTTYY